MLTFFHNRLTAIPGIVIVLLLAGTDLHSQPGDISLRRYSVDDGLSNPNVVAIAQDSAGFLWFGTEDGLNRFDGYSFSVYKHSPSDTSSICSSEIKDIICDRSGVLWIATAEGIDRFDQTAHRFIHAHLSPVDSILIRHPALSTLALGREHELWIGTIGLGLLLLDTRNGATRILRHDPMNAQSIANDSVRRIYLAHDGKLWVSYYAPGLSIYDIKTNTFSNFATDVPDAAEPTQTQIIAICEDHEQKLWFSSLGDGLFRFDDSLRQLVHYRHDPEDPDTYGDNTALVLTSDTRGTFWIGNSETGIDRFNFGENTFRHLRANPQDPGSPGSDRILSITEDRNGSVWFGTWHGGVNVYHPLKRKFVLIHARPGDPSSRGGNAVTAVCESSTGEVWIGTEHNGLNLYDPVSDSFTHFLHQPAARKTLSNNAVTAICLDTLGDVWVGTKEGGLNRFDRSQSTFECFEHRVGDTTSLSSNSVSALFVDYTGAVWAGTQEGILNRFIRSSNVFEHFVLGDAGAIRTIDEDHVGNVWIGTSMNGVYRYVRSSGAVRHYLLHEKDPLSSRASRIASIALSDDGNVWIGTEGGGLGRYVPERDTFELITESEGLPGTWIRGILADRHGRLWLSMSTGLARFDPRTRIAKLFGTEDGVKESGFSPGACWRGRRERMYFGGMNGVHWFDPDSVRDNPSVPQIFITSVNAGDSVLRLPFSRAAVEDLHFPSPLNSLSFDILALEYSSPERNKLACMLEGFDSTWIVSDGRRSVRYTNLGKGEYVFRVKGSNSDGVWNEAGASVRIVVHPQLWDQWWMRVLAIVGIAGIPLSLYRFRFRKVFAVERSRNKIVRELHDEVTSTLSGIDYYSEVVRNGIKQNDEKRVDKYLSLIREGASSAQDSLADIVWTVNPEHNGWEQLLSQFRRFASGLLERRSIRHAIEIPQDLPITPFPIETRRKFWLLYKEMLLHLVQLSTCKMVAVKVMLGDDRRLNLIIASDGNGVDSSNPERKAALASIRARVDELHCTLELDHASESGTTWKVYFPPG